MKLALLLLPFALHAADITGKWSGYPASLILKQDGSKVTGTAGPTARDQTPIANGTLEDDRLSFDLGPYHFALRIAGDEITGEITGERQSSRVMLKRVNPETGPVSRQAFEVASLKRSRPSPDGHNSSTMKLDLGRLTCINARVREMILRAYDLKDHELSGPGWLESERYDISATFPAGTPAERVQLMLQTLLAERLRLAVHRETKEVQAYALVVDKNGTKLKDVGFGRSSTSSSPGKLTVHSTRMVDFAEVLSRQLNRPVVDATGLAGFYEFTLEFAPERVADPAGPSIFTAIREQLGLRLEARKTAIETLVVDHIEKAPAEN
jgi:uncharacterized protein (TIGR03435 family)